MNPILAFIKLIRLPNLLIIVLTQYAVRYGIMYPYGYELLMTDLDFFLLCLSTVMIAAAGYIINDYFDVKVDRVNRPDKIIVGKHIKRRVAMGSHIIINSIALLVAAYVAYKVGNIKLIIIQVLTAGALWYYSTMFKKQVLIGNVVVALMAGLVPFVAGYYELTLQHNNIEEVVSRLMFSQAPGTLYEDVMYLYKESLSWIMIWVIGFSFFAFISTIAREIIKDIEDYEGDKKYYSYTLPVKHGITVGKRVAQLVLIIMIGAIGYFQYWRFNIEDMLSVSYTFFALQVPLIYVIYKLQIAKEKSDYHHLSVTMKGIMLSGLCYILVLYYLTNTL